MPEKFKVNTIVWAKVNGYPWWPASVREIRLPSASNKQSGIEYLVSFIGHKSYSELPHNKILDYLENYETFSKDRSKRLQDAIKIANRSVQQEDRQFITKTGRGSTPRKRGGKRRKVSLNIRRNQRRPRSKVKEEEGEDEGDDEEESGEEDESSGEEGSQEESEEESEDEESEEVVTKTPRKNSNKVETSANKAKKDSVKTKASEEKDTVKSEMDSEQPKKTPERRRRRRSRGWRTFRRRNKRKKLPASDDESGKKNDSQKMEEEESSKANVSSLGTTDQANNNKTEAPAAPSRLKIMRLKKTKEDDTEDNKNSDKEQKEKLPGTPLPVKRPWKPRPNRRDPVVLHKSSSSSRSGSSERNEIDFYSDVRSLKEKLGRIQSTLEKLDHIKLQKKLRQNHDDSESETNDKLNWRKPNTRSRNKQTFGDINELNETMIKKVKKENEESRSYDRDFEIEPAVPKAKLLENSLEELLKQLSTTFSRSDSASDLAVKRLDDLILKFETERFSGDEYVRHNTAKHLNKLYGLFCDNKHLVPSELYGRLSRLAKIIEDVKHEILKYNTAINELISSINIDTKKFSVDRNVSSNATSTSKAAIPNTQTNESSKNMVDEEDEEQSTSAAINGLNKSLVNTWSTKYNVNLSDTKKESKPENKTETKPQVIGTSKILLDHPVKKEKPFESVKPAEENEKLDNIEKAEKIDKIDKTDKMDKMDISPTIKPKETPTHNPLEAKDIEIEETDAANQPSKDKDLQSITKSEIGAENFPVYGINSRVTYDTRKTFGVRLAKAIFTAFKITKEEAQSQAALTERKILENFGDSDKNYKLAFKTLYHRIKEGRTTLEDLRGLQKTADKTFIQTLIFPTTSSNQN